LEQEKLINEAINSSVGLFFGEYAWVTLLALIAILFKSTIESSVAGLMIFLGRDYDDDDVVYLNDKPARIIRVGIWSTVFYIYDVEVKNSKPYIVGGKKLVVSNVKLKDMMLEKPLQNIELKESFFVKEKKEID
jgi:hypothetical protein